LRRARRHGSGTRLWAQTRHGLSPHPPRRPPWRPGSARGPVMSRGRLDRTAVLDAAERVANRDGFDALSLVAIAREVGVQPPSLYNHIDGLPGIRHGLHLRGLTLAVSEIQQATAGTSG